MTSPRRPTAWLHLVGGCALLAALSLALVVAVFLGGRRQLLGRFEAGLVEHCPSVLVALCGRRRDPASERRRQVVVCVVGGTGESGREASEAAVALPAVVHAQLVADVDADDTPTTMSTFTGRMRPLVPGIYHEARVRGRKVSKRHQLPYPKQGRFLGKRCC